MHKHFKLKTVSTYVFDKAGGSIVFSKSCAIFCLQVHKELNLNNGSSFPSQLLLAPHTVNHASSFRMHIGCLPYINTCIRHALISHPGTITWTSRQASKLKPHMYISNKSFNWEHFFSHWVFSSQHIWCQYHIFILFSTCTYHSTKTKRALLHQQLPPTSTLHQPPTSYQPIINKCLCRDAQD